jgi:hypothetical protein
MVVMEMMMVMVMRAGEGRSGEDHNQEHSSKQLFHELNLAREGVWKRSRKTEGPSEETSAAFPLILRRGVNWGQR